MNRFRYTLPAAVAALAISATASEAASFRLDATSLGRFFNGGSNFTTFSDFSVTYTDVNNNSLLDVSDTITDFSGVSVVTEAFGRTNPPSSYDTLQRIGNVSGFAEAPSTVTGSNADRWNFSRSNGSFSQDTDRWSYSVTQLTFDTAPVPLPAGLGLLLSALGGLGWMRLRRKA